MNAPQTRFLPEQKGDDDMPGQLRRHLVALGCWAGLVVGGLTMNAAATPAADAFTYQGRLTQAGEPVTDVVSLAEALAAQDPEDTVEVVWQRDEEELSAEVTLTEA
jgi:hypothetical protein